MDQEMKEILMEREVFSKEWEINTLRTAEAIILLDMIDTINRKSYDINDADMTVAIDNKAIWRIVYRGLVIPNHSNQDAAAEASLVKKLIEQCNIHLTLQKVISHKKITTLFIQDSGLYIVKYFDERARQVRETIDNRSEIHNIRYRGKLVITYKGRIASKVMSEVIRCIDIDKMEQRY